MYAVLTVSSACVSRNRLTEGGEEVRSPDALPFTFKFYSPNKKRRLLFPSLKREKGKECVNGVFYILKKETEKLDIYFEKFTID